MVARIKQDLSKIGIQVDLQILSFNPYIDEGFSFSELRLLLAGSWEVASNLMLDLIFGMLMEHCTRLIRDRCQEHLH